MKVALIENGDSFHKDLKKVSSELGWEISHFNNSIELERTNLNKYDVILTDLNLPVINGRDLIKSIATKTRAQIFLMTSYGKFIEEDVKNDRIKGLINKDDPESLIDCLKYADIKIRLNKIIETENGKYEDI